MTGDGLFLRKFNLYNDTVTLENFDLLIPWIINVLLLSFVLISYLYSVEYH